MVVAVIVLLVVVVALGVVGVVWLVKVIVLEDVDVFGRVVAAVELVVVTAAEDGVVASRVVVAADDAAVLVTAAHVSALDVLASTVLVGTSAAVPPAHFFGLIVADWNRSLAQVRKSHMVPQPPRGNAIRTSLIGVSSSPMESRIAAACSARSATV